MEKNNKSASNSDSRGIPSAEKKGKVKDGIRIGSRRWNRNVGCPNLYGWSDILRLKTRLEGGTSFT